MGFLFFDLGALTKCFLLCFVVASCLLLSSFCSAYYIDADFTIGNIGDTNLCKGGGADYNTGVVELALRRGHSCAEGTQGFDDIYCINPDRDDLKVTLQSGQTGSIQCEVGTNLFEKNGDNCVRVTWCDQVGYGDYNSLSQTPSGECFDADKPSAQGADPECPDCNYGSPTYCMEKEGSNNQVTYKDRCEQDTVYDWVCEGNKCVEHTGKCKSGEVCGVIGACMPVSTMRCYVETLAGGRNVCRGVDGNYEDSCIGGKYVTYECVEKEYAEKLCTDCGNGEMTLTKQVCEPRGVSACPELTIVKYNDIDGNGRLDSGEKALPGFVFEVTLPGGGVSTLTTDEQGKASINPAHLGEYSILEKETAGWKATTAQPLKTTLSAADPVQIKYFGNQQTGATLRIEKYNDQNNNKVKDTTESLLEGFSFTISGPSGESYKVTTGKKGEATQAISVNRQYTVTEDDKPGWSSTTGKTKQVSIDTMGASKTLSFGNRKPSVLKVTVFEDPNLNGVMDSGETPKKGIHMDLWINEKGGNSMESHPHLNDGELTEIDFPPGTYAFSGSDPLVGYYCTNCGVDAACKVSTAPAEQFIAACLGTSVLKKAEPVEVLAEETSEVFFGIAKQNKLGILKFQDRDGDGLFDGGADGRIPTEDISHEEVHFKVTGPLGNNPKSYEIIVNEDTMEPSHYNLPDGGYADLLNIPPGEYLVEELNIPAGVTCTTCTNGNSFKVQVDGLSKYNVGNMQTSFGSIKAALYNDANGDGSKGAGETGAGMSGFKFTATAANGQKYDATSDADGLAYFRKLPVGEYAVEEVNIPSEWTATTPTKIEKIVVSDSKESPVSFGNKKLPDVYGDLSILKYEDLDGDDEMDGDEKPLEGFVFDLEGPTDKPEKSKKYLLTTDKDGKAAQINIPGGTYTLTEQEKEEWTISEPKQIKLTREKNKVSLKIANRQENVGSLIVEKYEDTNDNGKKDPEDKPMDVRIVVTLKGLVETLELESAFRWDDTLENPPDIGEPLFKAALKDENEWRTLTEAISDLMRAPDGGNWGVSEAIKDAFKENDYDPPTKLYLLRKVGGEGFLVADCGENAYRLSIVNTNDPQREFYVYPITHKTTTATGITVLNLPAGDYEVCEVVPEGRYILSMAFVDLDGGTRNDQWRFTCAWAKVWDKGNTKVGILNSGEFKAQGTLSIYKCVDLNNNGDCQNTDDQFIGGVSFEIKDSSGVTRTLETESDILYSSTDLSEEKELDRGVLPDAVLIAIDDADEDPPAYILSTSNGCWYGAGRNSRSRDYIIQKDITQKRINYYRTFGEAHAKYPVGSYTVTEKVPAGFFSKMSSNSITLDQWENKQFFINYPDCTCAAIESVPQLMCSSCFDYHSKNDERCTRDECEGIGSAGGYNHCVYYETGGLPIIGGGTPHCECVTDSSASYCAGKNSCLDYDVNNCEKMRTPACTGDAYSGKVAPGDRCGVPVECGKNLMDQICWDK